MVRLSVNINKVATLRNSRGGRVPDPVDAVAACLRAGARGITVHPRADARHITSTDVRAIAMALAAYRESVEYNIEGDPRPDLMALVHEVRPDQLTLVPVLSGEITSQAGWPVTAGGPALRSAIEQARAAGIRVSLFIEADPEAVAWAAGMGADRVELFTEPYARAFEHGEAAARVPFERCVRAAERAHALGMGVNAGHDLDLGNLALFRTLPHLAEVSIGHALLSRALFMGLETVVREYLEVLAAAG